MIIVVKTQKQLLKSHSTVLSTKVHDLVQLLNDFVLYCALRFSYFFVKLRHILLVIWSFRLFHPFSLEFICCFDLDLIRFLLGILHFVKNPSTVSTFKAKNKKTISATKLYYNFILKELPRSSAFFISSLLMSRDVRSVTPNLFLFWSEK